MRREQHTKQDSLHRNGEWLDGMMYALLGRRVAQLALSSRSSPGGRQRGRGRLIALVLTGAGEPARSSACSSVSQVSTPKPTGCRAQRRHPGPGQSVAPEADVLEVRGAAPDHDAEGHQRVEPRCQRGRRRKTGSSNAPGYPDLDFASTRSSAAARAGRRRAARPSPRRATGRHDRDPPVPQSRRSPCPLMPVPLTDVAIAVVGVVAVLRHQVRPARWAIRSRLVPR